MFPAWDGELLLIVQKVTQNPFFDKFFAFYTSLGNSGMLWIAIGVLLLCFKKTRSTGLMMLISLLVTHLFNTLFLKHIINRPRPYTVMPEVRLLIAPDPESSFPSGHAATAFGSAMVIFLREKGWLRWTVLVLAILMAFSRLYVGVHYPLDVLAGAAVGTLVAALTVWVGGKVETSLQARRAANRK